MDYFNDMIICDLNKSKWDLELLQVSALEFDSVKSPETAVIDEMLALQGESSLST